MINESSFRVMLEKCIIWLIILERSFYYGKYENRVVVDVVVRDGR